ncbi:hypothetical protein [Salinicola rhizosphaerae]|nr:hypothetical protein [Salinicola rhizosphaerae]
MAWLENAVLAVGLIVVLAVYLHYVWRTRDVRGVLMFWLRRLALTPAEFKLQRAGIVVLFAGIVLRYVNMMQLI